ncbi:MAG: hypothetical protein QOH01_3124 [Verrucomicrobiota bacterium]
MKNCMQISDSISGVEAKVIGAAWDAVIIVSDGPRGRLFFFWPPEPSDGDFAARLGVDLGRGANPRLLHEPTVE